MDWGLLLALTMLAMAGIFFVLALFHRTKPEVLKFTSYGLITLAVLGLIVFRYTESGDLKISVLVFTVLAAIYHWFYRGTLKDSNSN